MVSWPVILYIIGGVILKLRDIFKIKKNKYYEIEFVNIWNENDTVRHIGNGLLIKKLMVNYYDLGYTTKYLKPIENQ